MNGANKNYKFGQKNNWRRTIWNEIVSRLKTIGKNVKTAVVLYLAGEQDLDRKVAIERGINPDNLLIVERDQGVADKLRATGKTVIIGDMIDILLAWGLDGQKIDVIYADLCCGLEPDVRAIHESMIEKTSLVDAIALVNFQRGRDPKINIAKQKMECFLDPFLAKHRGYLFMMLNACEMYSMALSFIGPDNNEIDLPQEVIKDYIDSAIEFGSPGCLMDWTNIRVPQTKAGRLFLKHLLSLHEPNYFSYKSGTLVMDSVIFQSPMRLERHRGKLGTATQLLWFDFIKEHEKIKEAKNQIAAALAVRTMRLNGQLPHSPAF